jgi:ATP-dependent RNA helicase DHX37/DHR1
MAIKHSKRDQKKLTKLADKKSKQ